MTAHFDGEGERGQSVRFPERRAALIKAMEIIAEYHLVDDPATYVFTIAVAASDALDGSPLWGMVIGPASGGKTEALAIVSGVVKADVDDFTVPALLSWHRATPKSRPTPTGILSRVGSQGVISIGDFSTVLSDAQRGRRDQLFSALRRIFDGRYQRDLGNEGSPLVWTGRVTLIAACTAAIDNYASHSDSLGPRWVYFRIPPRDVMTRRAVTSKAVRSNTSEFSERRLEAQGLVKELILEAGSGAEAMELSDELIQGVEEAAQVVCYGRASVPRDTSPRREITGLPDMEEPPRVAKQLIMLLRCLLAIGLSDHEALGVVSRVAIDTMTAVRALALGAVAKVQAPITTATIAKAASADWKVINRALEDFEVIGIVRRADDRDSDPWGEAVGDSDGAARAKPWILVEEDASVIRAVFTRRGKAILPELGV